MGFRLKWFLTSHSLTMTRAEMTEWFCLTVHEPPVEQGVVDEGLQHGHDAVPVLPQHLHHCVAGDPVVTIQACHLATQSNVKKPFTTSHVSVLCLYIKDSLMCSNFGVLTFLTLKTVILERVQLKTYYNIECIS